MGTQPAVPAALAPLSDADLDALRRAKYQLETPPLGMKLAALVGAPIEKLLGKLPAIAADKVNDATQTALRQCLRIALKTLGKHVGAAARAAGGTPEKPGNLLHKLAVATTGAAGGAFGVFALPVELPVTTTLMFRSICDIARSEGEDLASPEVQLQCLTVFALGGRPAGGKADEDVEYGYFIVRGALAQAVSKASSELATKGFAAHGSTALLRLMQNVAARFSVQVSEQVAAKSIPAIGAALGAMVNTVFIHHFQQVAHGHFAVRRLERHYGEAVVKAAYEAIDVSLD